MQRIQKGTSILLVGIAFAVLVLGYVLFFAAKAYANPSDLNQSNALATTTISYLTAGSTVVTETYDSYNGGLGDPNASESAVLYTNFTASSTSSVLAIKLQYSQNGIDWFDDNLLQTSLNSTTSPLYNMGTNNSYTWTALGTTVASKAITVPTPTRYVRAVYTVSGANAGVWKVIIAKKEQP